MVKTISVSQFQVFLAVFCTLLVVPSVTIADWQSEEYRIKAGFIYRFILFAEWPEQPRGRDPGLDKDRITIGILGDDPFSDYFSKVDGATVHGHKVLRIKRLGSFSSRLDLTACEVLFISRSEKNNLKNILASLFDRPVLTVSDIDNFCERGGMVNLVTIRHRVRFEVNLPAARKAGLRLDSNFLRAALRVLQNAPADRN